jgi:peptidoglycan lytic transglycosylase B
VRALIVLGFVVATIAPISGQTPPEPTPPPTPPPTPSATATAPLPPFPEWLAGVRAEAIAKGIGEETVTRALTGVEPVPQILERDRAQAEFTLTMKEYMERRLNYATLTTAKEAAAEYRALLARVGKTYDVPPRFLVSVWGLESNFGRFAGVRPMIPTLATLAYEPRRATFFRQQLLDALIVLDKGYIDLPRLNGSWAGAMGQPQFMPSSYLMYAQDFDGDGRRDIWTSQADVFASIAYYLQQHHWDGDQTWGRRVTVPAAARAKVDEAAPLRSSGCRAERQMTVPLTLDTWRKLGVRRADRGALPSGEMAASLVETDSGTSYLVYRNYEALLAYNCAHTYALSVSLLADAVGGVSPLPTKSSKPPKRVIRKKAGARGKRP